MKRFSFSSLKDENLRKEIQEKLARNNIPSGLYGDFEELAIKACLILGSSNPKLKRPATLLFAGDHTYKAPDGVNKGSNTSERVYQALNQTTAASILNRQNRMHLKVVDIGVNHQFESNLMYWLNHGKKLVNKKLGEGTRDFMEYPAMTSSDCNKAIEIGRNAILKEHKNGCNLIGISSISDSSFWSTQLISIALLELNPKKLEFESEEKKWIKKALNQHPKSHDPLTLLTLYGGYELVAMCGAYSQAAALGMIILVDGFESALALFIASRWNPEILDYCFLASKAENPLHQRILDQLKLNPTIAMESSVGEGYQIAMSFPLIQSACALIRELPDK